MDEYIYPNEATYWSELEANTRPASAGATPHFLTPSRTRPRNGPVEPVPAQGHGRDRRRDGAGLTNQEYAPLAEIMGRVPWASEVFNCAAPDTGNMETLPATARRNSRSAGSSPCSWRDPLGLSMTEPEVASSDATNICTRIEREGDEYVINGRKWWISGAGDPRCAVYITMGKTDPEAPRHSQQSMILVPPTPRRRSAPAPCSAMTMRRTATWRCTFENVRVPASNILLGEGRGFEIAQGRLGPGRIHHCMRLIGLAERAWS
jgi:acyl-CoA dehydrogenase